MHGDKIKVNKKGYTYYVVVYGRTDIKSPLKISCTYYGCVIGFCTG